MIQAQDYDVSLTVVSEGLHSTKTLGHRFGKDLAMNTASLDRFNLPPI
jgi:hypothetical protein